MAPCVVTDQPIFAIEVGKAVILQVFDLECTGGFGLVAVEPRIALITERAGVATRQTFAATFVAIPTKRTGTIRRTGLPWPAHVRIRRWWVRTSLIPSTGRWTKRILQPTLTWPQIISILCLIPIHTSKIVKCLLACLALIFRTQRF
jgi:hypothetical protein